MDENHSSYNPVLLELVSLALLSPGMSKRLRAHTSSSTAPGPIDAPAWSHELSKSTGQPVDWQ